MPQIPLTRGLFATVDQSDYEELSHYQWLAIECRPLRFYAGRKRPGGGLIYMHRQIMQPEPHTPVDHQNRNTLDNRRSNLRLSSRSSNAANAVSSRGRSRFKGVSLDPRKKTRLWYARITVHGVTKHLGSFETEVEAAKAYDSAALRLFGEFARLNFPESER